MELGATKIRLHYQCRTNLASIGDLQLISSQMPNRVL